MSMKEAILSISYGFLCNTFLLPWYCINRGVIPLNILLMRWITRKFNSGIFICFFYETSQICSYVLNLRQPWWLSAEPFYSFLGLSKKRWITCSCILVLILAQRSKKTIWKNIWQKLMIWSPRLETHLVWNFEWYSLTWSNATHHFLVALLMNFDHFCPIGIGNLWRYISLLSGQDGFFFGK